MRVAYLDTSVLGRVLKADRDAPAVLRALAGFDQLVSSWLLKVELRRLGARVGRSAGAEHLLARVALLPIDDSVLADAEKVGPMNVGTLDAIHLVTALTVRAEAPSAVMLTYDRTLTAAAAHHGLEVLEPA
jgi:predicted nucleic acid-binding protein